MILPPNDVLANPPRARLARLAPALAVALNRKIALAALEAGLELDREGLITKLGS